MFPIGDIQDAVNRTLEARTAKVRRLIRPAAAPGSYREQSHGVVDFKQRRAQLWMLPPGEWVLAPAGTPGADRAHEYLFDGGRRWFRSEGEHVWRSHLGDPGDPHQMSDPAWIVHALRGAERSAVALISGEPVEMELDLRRAGPRVGSHRKTPWPTRAYRRWARAVPTRVIVDERECITAVEFLDSPGTRMASNRLWLRAEFTEHGTPIEIEQPPAR